MTEQIRPLKPTLKVMVGIPFLGTGKPSEIYLYAALKSIKAQKTDVKILEPWVTSPAAGKGKQMDLVARKLNDLFNRFLQSNCTHIWLVNTDCELPPDALEKLIRLDVDIASGVSPTHTDWNAITTGYELPEGGLKFYRRMDIKDRVVGESEVVATGNFCVLVKRRVLLRYSPVHVPLRYQIKRERKYIYGPELQFFIDAQEMGFSVRIHGGVICGHLPEFPLSFKGPEDTMHKKMRAIKWREP